MLPGMSLRQTSRIRIAALAVDLAGPKAPTEFRLLPAGRFKAADGSGRPEGLAEGWLVDDDVAAALIAQAAARASDYAIDYDHQTLNAEKNGQPAPAAGWFKQLEWRPGDGLYAVGLRWTERAAQMLAAGEYRYLSPVFAYDKASGRVTALGPAALTNNPGLDGLTDLSPAALSALFPQEEEMQMKELLKALGLAETATEAEALAALAALKSAHGTELAALKASAPDPAKYVAVATMTALQGELATANAELAALKAKDAQAEVDKVIADGLAAGKLTPATEPHARKLATDLAALKGFIDAQPVIVKPGTTQTGGKKPEGAGTDQPTETDLAVMKALGLTAEQFALGKKEA